MWLICNAPGNPAAVTTSGMAESITHGWICELLRVVADCCSVTFTGCGLELAAREDTDLAAGIRDELSALQFAGGNGYRAPLHAEHVGEKLVGEVKMIRVGAVIRHQQPARQPGLDFMEAIAGGGLRQLPHQYVYIAVQHGA